MRYNEVIEYLQNFTKEEIKPYDMVKALGGNISKYTYRRDNNGNFTADEVNLLTEYVKSKYTVSNLNQISTNANIRLDYIQASCGNGITIDTSLIANYDANCKYSVAVAKGNSMSPSIENNDLCIIKRYSGEIIDGIYLFSIADDMYIKRLSNNINQLVCTSDNKDFDKIVLQGDELQKVNIVGQVVGLIRKF